jgi:Holliday junction resolvase-like predicted endonuclease
MTQGISSARRDDLSSAEAEEGSLTCQDFFVAMTRLTKRWSRRRETDAGAPRLNAYVRRTTMLSENDIIEAVCQHLERQGYRIDQRLTTKQRGHDIIAMKVGEMSIELHVEAKGETSDRQGSARHGKAFNSAQVSDHVAAAFYCAASMLDGAAPSHGIRAGIALPDTKLHRTHVARIRGALAKLEIAVFWVDASKKVSVESTWPV